MGQPASQRCSGYLLQEFWLEHYEPSPRFDLMMLLLLFIFFPYGLI